jgi:hypothetical protein
MPTDPAAVQAFLDNLQRQDEERRGVRKLVNLDIEETSAVAHPAHGVEGWLVAKAGTNPHDHHPDAFYPEGSMQQSANLLNLKAGEEVELAKGRTLGKDACGCLYLRSPESMAKAAGEEFVRQHHDRENAIAKAAGPTWTDEDFARLDSNKLLGRES